MARYAIMKRKKGVRRAYTDGYFSYDLEYMFECAKNLANSGEYTMVNIVDADTRRKIESFTPSEQ